MGNLIEMELHHYFLPLYTNILTIRRIFSKINSRLVISSSDIDDYVKQFCEQEKLDFRDPATIPPEKDRGTDPTKTFRQGVAGVTDVATGLPSLAGLIPAAAGAGYEAAYTQLEEGEIKGKNVQAGAAFGAAFGVLAGLGIMVRTSKNAPKPKNKASKDDTELTAIAEEVIPEKEQVKIKKVVTEINNKKESIHPAIQEGRDYRSVDLGTIEGRAIAKELGWDKKGGELAGFRGIRTFDSVDGIPYKFVDLMGYVKEKTNSKSKFNTADPPDFHKTVQVKDMYLDIVKLKNIGFKPKYNIWDGLDILMDNLRE